jgi:hypothetical protein
MLKASLGREGTGGGTVGGKGLLNTITKKILLLPSFPKLKITNVLIITVASHFEEISWFAFFYRHDVTRNDFFLLARASALRCSFSNETNKNILSSGSDD